MKAPSEPDRNPSENSHEKAQIGELPGPFHAPPEGAASVGRLESSKSLGVSSEISSVASGAWDAELKSWGDAMTREVQAGKALDALVLNKAPPEEIERADDEWHQAIESLAIAYNALPTVGDLELTMRLAAALAPVGPKDRASVALGRALAGVSVEAQRRMVALYEPHKCAATARNIMSAWKDWERAESIYREACGGLDLALRARMRAEITHWRRLMREVLFLWFCAEETRAIRRLVKRGVPGDVLRAFYDDELYVFLLSLQREAPGKGMGRELGELRAAADERARAQTFRTTPFAGFVQVPSWIRDRAELEDSRLLSIEEEEETTAHGVSWGEGEGGES